MLKGHGAEGDHPVAYKLFSRGINSSSAHFNSSLEIFNGRKMEHPGVRASAVEHGVDGVKLSIILIRKMIFKPNSA